MGADLLVQCIWTTRERVAKGDGDDRHFTDGVDFDAIEAAINALGQDDLRKLDSLDTYAYEDDDGEVNWDDVRGVLVEALESLKGIWHGEYNRTAFAAPFGPIWMAVTGGLSWGDSPTDEFDGWGLLIDADVLTQGGFFS